MNINFRKNISKSYMVVEDVKNFSTLDFETKMILSNKIGSLLSSDYEVIDDKVNFLYDISSKQAISKLFEITKINFEGLRAFIFALKNLAEDLDEYLLDANNVILKEDCIFSNMSCKDFSFCYFPYYHGDFTFELKELFNKIIKVINYDDDKAVRLAYRIVNEVQNENFVIGNLLNCFDDISDNLETAKEELDDLPMEIFEYVTSNPNPEPLADNDFAPLVALAEDDFEYEKIKWIDPSTLKKERHVSKKGKKNTDIDEFSEMSIFKKISAYVKGKDFFEILDDIDTGEIIKNIKGVVPPERYISPLKNNMPAMSPAIEGVPNSIANSFSTSAMKGFPAALSFNDLTDDFNFDKPQDGTVLLGRNESKNRRLMGVNASTGQVYEIKKMPFTIGKMNDKADALINSKTISRLHARIYEESNINGEYLIEDLNSTNGTFVNYKRIEPYHKVPIAVGDIICFADEEFCFK